MYLSFMSSTLRAVFSGSSASSQPRGLPVSTEQNRQARVHTAPISMMVAVPAFQHSPMFGHLASSQTVASRCSCTMLRVAPKPAPTGSCARIHAGLRPVGAASAPRDFWPSLMAVKPCGVTYFSPLRIERDSAAPSTTTDMSFSEAIACGFYSCGGIPESSMAPGGGPPSPGIAWGLPLISSSPALNVMWQTSLSPSRLA